jgi:hypothetical protein
VEFLERNPVPDGIPEDKEVMFWTTATFACPHPETVFAELSKRSPEFIFNGQDDDGADSFTWTRAYPKKHWSPLSKLGGRQTLGGVRIFPDRIVADSKVLSNASILIGILKAAFGDDIRLTGTTWKSSEDFIRERDAARGGND